MRKKRRASGHRGVVLRLDDAAAVHRMLEFFLDYRRFDNPIVALEVRTQAQAAKARLEGKLVRMLNG
jgi:hypothetical protein